MVATFGVFGLLNGKHRSTGCHMRSNPGGAARRPTYLSAIFLLALSACTTISPFPKAVVTPVVTPAPQMDIAALPGDYGLASYHKAEDRERTIEQAKIACGNPYTIGAGSNGGVLMHAIGQNQQTEIFLKVGQDGQSYLGPKGPAGIPQDRLVVSDEDGVLILEWLDKSARSVYGTMIYVPCA